MSETEPQPAEPTHKLHWLHPTPGRCPAALLIVELLLWLSERFQWFGFNHQKGCTVLISVAMMGGAILAMLVWFMVALVFRWRFQFSIRLLLVLAVAVATPFSWLAVEMKKAREQRDAVAAFEKLDGSVAYECEFDWLGDPVSVRTSWPVGLFGFDFFWSLTGVDFWCRPITDSDLKNFKGLLDIRSLGLGGTKIADTGLECLEGAVELQTLDLRNTQVTDAGLAHLIKLTAPRYLELRDSMVTDEGVRTLQQALPRCKIEWEPPPPPAP